MNHNQTHNNFPAFDINEDDIDSDVLSEDDSDNDEMDVQENEKTTEYQSGLEQPEEPMEFLQDSYYDNPPYEPFDEDEEQYKEFLRSVRFYDDSNLGFEKNPLLDDEEEYEPEAFDETSDLDEIDEDEDDLNSEGGDMQDPDYDDDAEFFDHINDMNRVRPKELKDLLGDSWRTITDHTAQNNQYRSSTNTEDGGHAALNSNSLFSSLLAQFFAGQQITEATIDNIPLSTIRKLVARQMSMSLQLLIQILIQAEDKSTCFTRGTQCLLALNNFRMAAVKKAALLQGQVENMLAVKLQINSNTQQATASAASALNHLQGGYHTENNVNSNIPTNNKAKILRKHQIEQLMQEVAPQLLSAKPQQPLPAAVILPVVPASSSSHYQYQQQQAAVPVEINHRPQQQQEQEQQNRRMTRSNYINYDLQSKRSSSILDVPLLSHMNDLLQQIDIAQKRYRAQVLQVAMDQQLATVYQHQILLADHAISRPAFRRSILHIASNELQNVFAGLQVPRRWQCLVPLPNYPFSLSLHAQLDPTSITGRSYFTPAEDDLMLRGILQYGDREDSWYRIREQYLPSKEAIILRYYYDEKMGKSTNNIFRRYQSIRDRGWIENCPKDDRWQHVEDLAIVRGFMVCGPQWPHVVRLLLPHRRPKDVRLRWRALIKTWQRAFPSEQQPSQYLRTMLMTPKLAAFLIDLQQCKDLPALQVLRREGGRHLQQLEFPDGVNKQGTDDNSGHSSHPRAEFELDPSSLNDISCDELSDDDDHEHHSNRGSNQPSPDSFPDEEANKKKGAKAKKPKVVQLDENGEPIKRRVHRKRAVSSNSSPTTLFLGSTDLETSGKKGKRHKTNSASSFSASLPVLDESLIMAPALPPSPAAIAVMAVAAPQQGLLGGHDNTMDELMGFSNFTRDMSMLKATFRKEDGGVGIDQPLQYSQLSSSSRQSQQQSSSQQGPPREGGLFASVMSGANFK